MPRNPLIGFNGTAALCLTAGAAWSQPLTIWWNKGYYPEEDQRFEEIVDKWEQETGNEAVLSFYVTEDLPRKVVAALDAV